MPKQPFRSIEMRGRQTSGRSDLRAPDRTKQMAELARQESEKLKSAHESLSAARRFQNYNDQVLEETAIEQQRLQSANLSTNSKLANDAAEAITRQDLAGQEMAMQQQNQIRNMRKAQEIIRNQLSQQIGSQQTKSLSDFGEKLLSFSGTLWKEKAEEINQANLRLQAQGQLDGMLKNFKIGNELIDIAQDSRVASGQRIDNEARQLDAEGKPVDATNLRAHNGFYTYGVHEGMAIKNSVEIKAFLQAVKEDAIQKGIINFGDRNADQKLQVLLQERSIDFMIERGIVNLPPEIQQKYFAEGLIKSQASVMAEFNDANGTYTKDASVGLAIQQIRTGSRNLETFKGDLPNLLTQLYSKDPAGFKKNLMSTFKALKANSRETRSMDALDDFITVLQVDENVLAFSQEVIDEYHKWEEAFDKAEAKAANDAATELAANLKGRAQDDFSQVTTVDAQAEIRDYYWNQSENLPFEQRGAFREWLMGQRASTMDAAINANDEFLADNPTPDEIRQRIEDNPQMPQNEKNRLQRTADNLTKFYTEHPEYKAELDQAKASISARMAKISAPLLNQYPQLKTQQANIVALRQKKLETRFIAWATKDGEKSLRDMQEWLKNNNKDLLENPIVFDEETSTFPELQQNYGSFETGAERIKDVTPRQIGNTNRNGIFFIAPDDRANARSGKFGALDSTTGVFLSPAEIATLSKQYEDTGVIDPLLRDLSGKANVSPKRFLIDQAGLWGLRGSIQEPKPEVKLSPVNGRVSEQDALDMALKADLSPRGAIMFANAMMMESGGNPRAEHDPENGVPTGYGLFGHRLSRRDALFEFAKQKGVDKSDPTTQLEFALAELKSLEGNPRYGHVWATVTAPNPTDGQLFAAMRDWLRFSKSVYQLREQSLYKALRRN